MASWNFSHVLAVGDKKISGKGLWVEANFPSMFTFKMLKGNINALNDPSSVLLSETLAKALFGNDNAVNKIVKFDNKDNFKVAGVYQDLPHNSTLSETKLLLPGSYVLIARDLCLVVGGRVFVFDTVGVRFWGGVV